MKDANYTYWVWVWLSLKLVWLNHFEVLTNTNANASHLVAQCSFTGQPSASSTVSVLEKAEVKPTASSSAGRDTRPDPEFLSEGEWVDLLPAPFHFRGFFLYVEKTMLNIILIIFEYGWVLNSQQHWSILTQNSKGKPKHNVSNHL